MAWFQDARWQAISKTASNFLFFFVGIPKWRDERERSVISDACKMCVRFCPGSAASLKQHISMPYVYKVLYTGCFLCFVDRASWYNSSK
jgi:hypothetical protein